MRRSLARRRLGLSGQGNNRTSVSREGRLFAAALLLGGLTACGSISPEENFLYGALGVTAVGAQAPSHEIQQIYYFGVFDPQDQLPPQMYRIRVHGQASFISLMQFASGWVPARFVDSLSSNVQFSDEGRIEIKKGDDDLLADLSEDRRLMLFGPQGFREAPKDHRLVIVMGASPEAFFEAMDQTAGKLSEVIEERRNSQLTAKLFQALTLAKADRERLTEFRRALELSSAQQKAATTN